MNELDVSNFRQRENVNVTSNYKYLPIKKNVKVKLNSSLK